MLLCIVFGAMHVVFLSLSVITECLVRILDSLEQAKHGLSTGLALQTACSGQGVLVVHLAPLCCFAARLLQYRTSIAVQ